MFFSNNNRVQSRLLRVFLLQLVLISVATIIGVIVASLIFERLLVNKALRGEAEFFWTNRAQSSDFALPETLNLMSFLASDAERPVPAAYKTLALGQHKVDVEGEQQIVHVSEQNGDRLYLQFARGTVNSLAFYFGVVPLILVLLTMYGFAFLAYLLSKQAVSPITRLASVIENFDFSKRDAAELNLANLEKSTDFDTGILVKALDHFVQRSRAFIDRERDFTRFASHELRTPLAVIQGSVSSLELLDLDGAPKRAVQRIKKTTHQMGDLLNTLLLLAREETGDAENKNVTCSVNDCAEQLLTQLKEVFAEKEITAKIEHRESVFVRAPESVLSIVLGNVLGNAFSYTNSGTIYVLIDNKEIVITDSGVGMSTAELDKAFEPFYRVDSGSGSDFHQGLGLSIVQQSCKNYGWTIRIDSQSGEGTRVSIKF